ncbi:MAG: nucleotidyltransferase family protein [Chloroflexi bacterium]|nr:nucleotidyltransferase family protein [Chloroflexota bacterium]
MFALILAGGLGERLRPLTDKIPKPMVRVCGRPILAHQIDWLKAGGVTDVVFLAGYCWQAIQNHFGDGQDFGIRAHYSVEDSPLGRGGAVN